MSKHNTLPPARIVWRPAVRSLAISSTQATLVFWGPAMVTKLVHRDAGRDRRRCGTRRHRTALLVGYGYAHLLQRIGSMVTVGNIWCCWSPALLPLRINGWDQSAAPVGWHRGDACGIGRCAFRCAVGDRTAVAKTWYARVRVGHADGQNPYVLARPPI
jgi:hypothetical protein